MAAGTSTTAAWRPRVVIVGGGPAGALAANFMARRGCDVKLYERATFNKDNEGRSYVVVLTRRGLDAIQRSGVQLPPGTLTHVEGFARATGRGSAIRHAPTRSPTFSITRSRLSNALLEAARQGHAARQPSPAPATSPLPPAPPPPSCLHPAGPGSVEVHLGYQLADLDFSARCATFEPVTPPAPSPQPTSPTTSPVPAAAPPMFATTPGLTQAAPPGPTRSQAPGAQQPLPNPEQASGGVQGGQQQLSLREEGGAVRVRQSVEYDLLLGADGTSSRVRELLAAHCLAHGPQPLTVTQTLNPSEYKTVQVPFMERVVPGYRSTFISLSDRSGKMVLLGGATHDGRMFMPLIMEKGEHARHTSAEQYRNTLLTHIPAVDEEQAGLMAQQLASTPVSHGGWNTRCSHIHGPHCFLIGDAAHSVWPSLGQGANSALEDVVVLDRLMGEAGALTQAGLAALPEAFQTARHRDMLAVVEMTETEGSRQRGPAQSLFFLRVGAQMLLHKLLPGLVPVPAFIIMQTTLTPYTEVQRQMQQEGQAVAALAVASLGAGLALALRLLLPLA